MSILRNAGHLTNMVGVSEGVHTRHEPWLSSHVLPQSMAFANWRLDRLRPCVLDSPLDACIVCADRSSRGGFDLEAIMDFIINNAVSDVSVNPSGQAVHGHTMLGRGRALTS